MQMLHVQQNCKIRKALVECLLYDTIIKNAMNYDCLLRVIMLDYVCSYVYAGVSNGRNTKDLCIFSSFANTLHRRVLCVDS